MSFARAFDSDKTLTLQSQSQPPGSLHWRALRELVADCTFSLSRIYRQALGIHPRLAGRVEYRDEAWRIILVTRGPPHISPDS